MRHHFNNYFGRNIRVTNSVFPTFIQLERQWDHKKTPQKLDSGWPVKICLQFKLVFYEGPLVPAKNKIQIRYYGFAIRYYGLVIRYNGFAIRYYGLVIRYYGLVIRYYGLVIRYYGFTICYCN